MKRATKTRPPAPTPATPPAAESTDLRELLTLIGQVPPELENFLIDRRANEREAGR